MSKATKYQHASSPSDAIRERAQRALAEGRSQSALDLAKQWHRAEPGPESKELLKQAVSARSKQLRDQNYFTDAAGVIEAGMAHVAGDAVQIAAWAEDLARCGAVAAALRWLATIPDPKPANKVQILSADAALQRGMDGRALLPAAMHADFDRVREAFAHLEAGRDDALRDTLAGISLTSPFLEWRVLLRGLLAFYQNDPARAIENWSRLDPQRFPARLAAPFRLGIDRKFVAEQSPAMQRALQLQADRLGNDPIVRSLRDIQKSLADDSKWREALNAIERTAAILKDQRPDLMKKLARITYCEIIERGRPEDMTVYVRAFGLTPDDPQFHRMGALACERHNDLEEAHGFWGNYENDVATMAHLTPEVRDRLRAHIWFRMASNAQTFSAAEPSHAFFMVAPTLRALKPAESACMRNAARLAPDWLEPVYGEFCIVAERSSSKAVIRAGEKLLKQFPGHAPTLLRLAQVCRRNYDQENYHRYLRAAAAADPLNRDLQTEFGWTEVSAALVHLRNSYWADAREILARCIQSPAKSVQFLALAAQALCELGAGENEAGEAALRRCGEFPTLGPSTDAVCAALAAQWSLPADLYGRFAQPFKAQLAGTPSLMNVTAWVNMFALFQSVGLEYYGQKGHLKKVLTLAGKVGHEASSPQDMLALGQALLELFAYKPLIRLAKNWAKQQIDNALPLVLEIEATIKSKPGRGHWYRVSTLVSIAKQRMKAMPAGPLRDLLDSRIAGIDNQIRSHEPFAAVFDLFDENDDEGDF